MLDVRVKGVLKAYLAKVKAPTPAPTSTPSLRQICPKALKVEPATGSVSLHTIEKIAAGHESGGGLSTRAIVLRLGAPEFARSNVAWMDGRNGPAQSTLPSIEDVPVPEVFTRLPGLHVDRPRGAKAMIDAAGAKARLRDARAGAWLISSYTGWKWAKWPDGNVGWVPADVK